MGGGPVPGPSPMDLQPTPENDNLLSAWTLAERETLCVEMMDVMLNALK